MEQPIAFVMAGLAFFPTHLFDGVLKVGLGHLRCWIDAVVNRPRYGRVA